MMQPLQMVRAEISMREFHRWMGERRLQDPDHGMHCLLTECFGNREAKRNKKHEDGLFRIFRLITPRGGSQGVLYAYGRADADELRGQLSTCGDPLQCKVIRADSIDSKPMPTEWPVGKRLGFEARVRPTRRLTRPIGDNGKFHVAERDAFLMQALDEKDDNAQSRGCLP